MMNQTPKPGELERLPEACILCSGRPRSAKNRHFDSVKAALRPSPVVGVSARLVAKICSGHRFAVAARIKPDPEATRP